MCSEIEGYRDKKTDLRREAGRKTEATDPGHFHAPGPFASPFPHPSIYLPSTHPSPLSPLLPCRAGPAFHLLSVPARSNPVPPPLAFTIQLKATSPFFFLLLLIISFFSCAWMSTAERPIPHVRMQSWQTRIGALLSDSKPTDDTNTHWHINTQSVRKRAKEKHTQRWTHSHTHNDVFSSFWRYE